MKFLQLLSTTLVSLVVIRECHSNTDIPVPKLFGRRAAAGVYRRSSNDGSALVPMGEERSEATVLRRANCGPGIESCPIGQCCSAGGVCGTSKQSCSGPDCQFPYGPACDANTTPPGSSTEGVPRPKLGKYPYGGAGIFECAVPNTIALTYDDGKPSMPTIQP